MNVVYVTTGLGVAGAEAQIVSLATRFLERGYRTTVVSMTPPVAFASELEESGVVVDTLNMRRGVPDPRAVFALIRRLRAWQPDVVHSHMVHANLLTRIARPFAHVPVLISTAHNIREGPRWREIAYRMTDRFCDLTTNVSRAAVSRYVEVGAVRPERIRYMPNGVDTELFRPNLEARTRLRRQLGVDHQFVLLAVGRLVTPKDYFTMLAALSTVVRQEPSTVLLIAGDGPLQADLSRRSADIGLSPHLRFLGRRSDVPELMNAADCYVMSSAWEGLPLVLLEASATGIPVIATDVGGNAEIVDDGLTGFIVPPGRGDSLAEAILGVMEMSESDRRDLGVEGRLKMEREYAIDHIVDMWEACYRELMQRT